MANYIEIVSKIISENNNNKNTGVLIVDEKGYIEYFKPLLFNSNSDFNRVAEKEIGKHVLELYPELTEEESTVIHTLKTREAVIGKRQEFTWNGKKMNFVSTTYPIIEDERICGVVDLATFVNILDGDSKKNDRQEGRCILDSIITGNEKMKRLKENIKNTALNQSSVLIYGETGTGKEMVAKAIHMEGLRYGNPFISQNCAAIPSTLLESMFFGTEKGGFTGAEMRKGLFEMADKGTLFLDEINSMDIGMQAKLLRAIEEKKVRRVGGSKDIPFDIRIVCATNEKPEKLLEEKRMRADFYYRIGVVNLDIPPLRERREDIPLLVTHFIKIYNEQMCKDIKGITSMAEELLNTWIWPGNVREIGNIIESAFNIELGEYITLASLEELRRRINYTSEFTFKIQDNKEQKESDTLDEAKDSIEKGEGIILDEILENIEKEMILMAIDKEKVLSKAAESLGISPQKLQYRMNKLKIK